MCLSGVFARYNRLESYYTPPFKFRFLSLALSLLPQTEEGGEMPKLQRERYNRKKLARFSAYPKYPIRCGDEVKNLMTGAWFDKMVNGCIWKSIVSGA